MSKQTNAGGASDKAHLPHYLQKLKVEPSFRDTGWGQIEVQPVRVTLDLRKHFYTMNGETFHLDSRGYECMAGATGCMVVNPHTIPRVIDGKTVRVGNPYVIRDPKTGEISGAACKKVVLGMMPTGDLQITERYVELDLRIIFLQHLRSKLQRTDCKDAGATMSLQEYNQLPAKKRSGHIRFILHEGRDALETVVMIFKVDHPEFRKAINERLKLANDLVKKTETIAFRLAAAKSPITRVDGIPKEDVIGFQKIGDKPWNTKYYGEVQINTYQIGAMKKQLGLMALALSVGDTSTVKEAIAGFGEDNVHIDSKEVSGTDALGSDPIIDAEFTEDSGTDSPSEAPAKPQNSTVTTRWKCDTHGGTFNEGESCPECESAAKPVDLSVDPELDNESQPAKAEAVKPTPKSEPESPKSEQPKTISRPLPNGIEGIKSIADGTATLKPQPTELDAKLVAQRLSQLKRAIPVIPPGDWARIMDDHGFASIEDIEAAGGAVIIELHELVYKKYINKK